MLLFRISKPTAAEKISISYFFDSSVKTSIIKPLHFFFVISDQVIIFRNFHKNPLYFIMPLLKVPIENHCRNRCPQNRQYQSLHLILSSCKINLKRIIQCLFQIRSVQTVFLCSPAKLYYSTADSAERFHHDSSDKPCPHRIFHSVQRTFFLAYKAEYQPFITIQNGQIPFVKLPNQNRNSCVFFWCNSGNASEFQLVVLYFRCTNNLWMRTTIRHLFQIYIAAIGDI